MAFLYHIRPRFFGEGIDAWFSWFRIEALGIDLKEAELATGQPYPNKAWKVGCRKIGHEAVDGILIVLPEFPPDIVVRARWYFGDCTAVHDVTYKLLDREFMAASDDMTMWGATGGHDGRRRFENRLPHSPSDAEKSAPLSVASPRMDTSLDRPGDRFSKGWKLFVREEVFELPTIEPERIIGDDYPHERLPLPTLEIALRR